MVSIQTVSPTDHGMYSHSTVLRRALSLANSLHSPPARLPTSFHSEPRQPTRSIMGLRMSVSSVKCRAAHPAPVQAQRRERTLNARTSGFVDRLGVAVSQSWEIQNPANAEMHQITVVLPTRHERTGLHQRCIGVHGVRIVPAYHRQPPAKASVTIAHKTQNSKTDSDVANAKCQK